MTYSLRTNLLLLAFSFFIVGQSMVHAQHWNPFPGKAPIHYSHLILYSGFNHETSYFGVRIDSVRLEGNDSAYYHFRIDRPMLANEYRLTCNGDTVKGPYGIKLNEQHFMGEKMLRNVDGTCKFIFTGPSDTMVLETFAQPGDTWTWRGNTTATVLWTGTENVSDVLDSIKVFKLSTGYEFKLSRSFGFVQVNNLKPVGPCGSFDCQLKLVQTRAYPFNSRTIPHFAETFDFEPGDLFRYHNYHWLPTGVFHGESETEIIIQSREPGSPLTYQATFERKGIVLPPSILTVYLPPQPITLTYDPVEMAYLDLLPYEHNPNISNTNWAPMQGGLHASSYSRIKSLLNIIQYFPNDSSHGYLDTCAQLYVTTDNPLIGYYAVGLGNVADLECYTKNGKPNWECYPLRENLFTDTLGQMHIYPNPAKETVHVLLNPSEERIGTQLTMYDATGAKVKTLAIEDYNFAFAFDISDLRPGMYVIGLEGPKIRTQTKRFIVLR